jgi:hypothetical protein
MYWKAVIVKYEGENHIRVGILLFETAKSDQPILCILSAIDCSGMKNKWRRPIKIKRWLLYDPHSYSYASRFLKKTIFNDDFKITEIGEKTELGLFDKDIIKKKFPSMTKEWVKTKRKKKRK